MENSTPSLVAGDNKKAMAAKSTQDETTRVTKPVHSDPIPVTEAVQGEEGHPLSAADQAILDELNNPALSEATADSAAHEVLLVQAMAPVSEVAAGGGGPAWGVGAAAGRVGYGGG
ncbi:MAG: hypothetical protein HQL87_12655, partial [Magnetococcales bacterium]|nr:hypothetical protein [Magnetococcales bacterium]